MSIVIAPDRGKRDGSFAECKRGVRKSEEALYCESTCKQCHHAKLIRNRI